ncbi:Putative cytosolic protein (plasmid) [Borrelia nietonii YOR]|uniref:Putative cytosolic protein n=2 Tax=Borrelia TaxID=138 RepID=W5SAD4_9SPIR|nr:Putative cytosolic protein [Borrelia nietonii YOR]
MKMSELYDQNYYAKEISNIFSKIKLPVFYNWFSNEQIEDVDLKTGYLRTIKWDAFLNANPTTLVNEVNTIATIGFRSEAVKLNYLKLQYKFRHLKQTSEQFYKNNDYAGDVNNNLLPFKEAYKLAINEIIKLINHFILTGTVSIQKDGKNQKRMLPNMYGLLNMPDQVKEEVSSSDKDKMDKIFEKIESGLAKLELGDEFSTPMMVLVDQATSLKLVKPYAIPNASSSSNIYSSTDSWEDFLVKTIKAVNNRQEVYVETSNLLSNQILIYPLNAELIKFKPSKYMLPMPNEQVDKDSTDIAHSYIDFVLGGLLATQKTILRVDIKQS